MDAERRVRRVRACALPAESLATHENVVGLENTAKRNDIVFALCLSVVRFCKASDNAVFARLMCMLVRPYCSRGTVELWHRSVGCCAEMALATRA